MHHFDHRLTSSPNRHGRLTAHICTKSGHTIIKCKETLSCLSCSQKELICLHEVARKERGRLGLDFCSYFIRCHPLGNKMMDLSSPAKSVMAPRSTYSTTIQVVISRQLKFSSSTRQTNTTYSSPSSSSRSSPTNSAGIYGGANGSSFLLFPLSRAGADTSKCGVGSLGFF